MKTIFLTLVFLTLTLFGFGQSTNGHSYKKAKIYLNNHRIVKVNNLEIKGLEAAFTNSESNQREKIAMSNVNLIRVPKGSYLLEGALYGAGTMALTAVLIDVQPDPLGIEQKRSAGFYLGLTAGGAAVGALIGSLFPKWKQVYDGKKFIGLNLPLNLDFSTQNNKVNIKITLSI